MNSGTISQARRGGQEGQAKLLALIEMLLVYGIFLGLLQVLRSTEVVQGEFQNLGWSYIGGLLFFIPALVIWLRRRNWTACLVASSVRRRGLYLLPVSRMGFPMRSGNRCAS